MSNKERAVVFLENTKFIYRTNFAGNPDNDKYGNKAHRGTIVIPTEELADEIRCMGIDVKMTKPREGEEEGFEPVYYMPIIINYSSDYARYNPPIVALVVPGREPEILNEDTIGKIDGVYITNVNASIEIVYLAKYDKYAAYVKKMYVEQDVDDDPWYDKYHNN